MCLQSFDHNSEVIAKYLHYLLIQRKPVLSFWCCSIVVLYNVSKNHLHFAWSGPTKAAMNDVLVPGCLSQLDAPFATTTSSRYFTGWSDWCETGTSGVFMVCEERHWVWFRIEDVFVCQVLITLIGPSSKWKPLRSHVKYTLVWLRPTSALERFLLDLLFIVLSLRSKGNFATDQQQQHWPKCLAFNCEIEMFVFVWLGLSSLGVC